MAEHPPSLAELAEPAEPAEAPPGAAGDDLEAGVIHDARRRQQRHRAGAAAVVLAAAIAAVVASADGGRPARPPVPSRSPASLRWLTGSPLASGTHLHLLVSGNEGPAAIVDVATGRVRPLTQLGVFRHRTEWSPTLALSPLQDRPGTALAVVSAQRCSRCALTETDSLVAVDGAVRPVATRHFPGGARTIETRYVPGSTAEWALTRPRRGPCTLRRIPSTHHTGTVPCGDLGPAFPGGVALWTHHDQRGVVLDSRSGAVRSRVSAFGFAPVGHGFAIESRGQSYPSALELVNLQTGHRLRLGWPSILHFGYQVFPQPRGPLVAIDFADPAYPPPPQQTVAQAADVWVLNTVTGKLVHLPGFPSLMYIKVSGIAWADDNRLVIAAAGGGRTAVALWSPGQRTLRAGAVPALHGYTQVVPLS